MGRACQCCNDTTCGFTDAFDGSSPAYRRWHWSGPTSTLVVGPGFQAAPQTPESSGVFWIPIDPVPLAEDDADAPFGAVRRTECLRDNCDGDDTLGHGFSRLRHWCLMLNSTAGEGEPEACVVLAGVIGAFVDWSAETVSVFRVDTRGRKVGDPILTTTHPREEGYGAIPDRFPGSVALILNAMETGEGTGLFHIELYVARYGVVPDAEVPEEAWENSDAPCYGISNSYRSLNGMLAPEVVYYLGQWVIFPGAERWRLAACDEAVPISEPAKLNAGFGGSGRWIAHKWGFHCTAVRPWAWSCFGDWSPPIGHMKGNGGVHALRKELADTLLSSVRSASLSVPITSAVGYSSQCAEAGYRPRGISVEGLAHSTWTTSCDEAVPWGGASSLQRTGILPGVIGGVFIGGVVAAVLDCDDRVVRIHSCDLYGNCGAEIESIATFPVETPVGAEHRWMAEGLQASFTLIAHEISDTECRWVLLSMVARGYVIGGGWGWWIADFPEEASPEFAMSKKQQYGVRIVRSGTASIPREWRAGYTAPGHVPSSLLMPWNSGGVTYPQGFPFPAGVDSDSPLLVYDVSTSGYTPQPMVFGAVFPESVAPYEWWLRDNITFDSTHVIASQRKTLSTPSTSQCPSGTILSAVPTSTRRAGGGWPVTTYGVWDISVTDLTFAIAPTTPSADDGDHDCPDWNRTLVGNRHCEAALCGDQNAGDGFDFTTQLQLSGAGLALIMTARWVSGGTGLEYTATSSYNFVWADLPHTIDMTGLPVRKSSSFEVGTVSSGSITIDHTSIAADLRVAANFGSPAGEFSALFTNAYETADPDARLDAFANYTLDPTSDPNTEIRYVLSSVDPVTQRAGNPFFDLCTNSGVYADPSDSTAALASNAVPDEIILTARPVGAVTIDYIGSEDCATTVQSPVAREW